MKSYHPAFETVSEIPIPEYRATGILLRHLTTGCEVYHLRSEDEENTFAFCFRTPPSDSTGAAHIVEHSVLCGSRRFPVKDAFLALARGSLATFLNAFTYPDKTVYPAASAVEADYFNLMDVYGDAVFRPLITEDIFLQEAHHLEYGADGRLDRKGVVYNEMRGAYSSPDSILEARICQALFAPGHPYNADSGGDPDEIPQLTYEEFRKFWERHYHPSNCRIFLHGCIPTERQLEFLEDHFLSAFSRSEPHTEVPLQSAFDAPVRKEYPFPAEDGTEAKTTTLVSWLTIMPENGVDSLTLEILGEILLGSDGAPLYHALAESGLGEDLSPHSGLDMSLRQSLFSAGLRGSKRGQEEEIERRILDCVSGLVRGGVPQNLLDAALHSIEFSTREIRRGGGTYGLRLFSRAIRGWLHGAAPETTLTFAGPLAELRRRMSENPRYLEEKLRLWILDNPHRATVTIYPDAPFARSRREEHRAALDALDSSLDEKDRERLRKRAAELATFQETPDEPQARDSVPLLRRSDISETIETIPRRTDRVADVPASLHPLFTNGVVYADFAFSLSGLSAAVAPHLSLLSRFVPGAGLPGRPYDEVARSFALRAGGFSALLQSATPIGASPDQTSSWLVFRLKALARNFPSALDLASELMTNADFGDLKRLKDLLNELANDVVSAVVPAGSSFASTRAAASFSVAQRMEEDWRGITQFQFLSAARSEMRVEDLAEDLQAILRSVVVQEGLRINLTADPEDLGPAREALETAVRRIPLRPKSIRPFRSVRESGYGPTPSRCEGWIIPAQVGFSAVSLPASSIGTPAFAHEQILGHLLSTSVLWDEIRVKGGAYGASAWTDGSESTFSFSSYRDPSPNASLDAYRSALESLVRDGLEKDSLERAVVGAVGRDLRPLMPEEKGFMDFKRELYGVTDEIRARKRRDLLSVRTEDLMAAAERLLKYWDSRAEVLISHEDDIKSMQQKKPASSIHTLRL